VAASAEIPSPRSGESADVRAAAPVVESTKPLVARPAPEAPMAVAQARGIDEETLVVEPYIESERCTSCNECTNVNKKMFAYNADKQAYVKDARAGTFAQLVMAAEKCPVGAIHPGTPLNPKEKDLDKWLKRAQAF
jgi:pyruvate-ferredoxin/flavodoxin oxidoreductase